LPCLSLMPPPPHFARGPGAPSNPIPQMPRESNAKNYSFTSWETDPFTRALETDALADVWRKLVPAEWTLMLGATSKRIRAALARLPMHVRLPAVVQFPKPWERQGDKDRKTVEAISCGLPRLQEWCLITTLNLALCRIGDQGIAGVKMLSKALEGLPSLTHLKISILITLGRKVLVFSWQRCSRSLQLPILVSDGIKWDGRCNQADGSTWVLDSPRPPSS
jgi:hypothetical protein